MFPIFFSCFFLLPRQHHSKHSFNWVTLQISELPLKELTIISASIWKNNENPLKVSSASVYYIFNHGNLSQRKRWTLAYWLHFTFLPNKEENDVIRPFKTILMYPRTTYKYLFISISAKQQHVDWENLFMPAQ